MTVRQIKTALCDIISAMPTPMVPTTTLHNPAAAGSLAVDLAPCVDLAGHSLIVEASRLRYFDGTDEAIWTVNTVTPAADAAGPYIHVTLEPAPEIGMAGLLHDHVAGATVTSHLLDYGPGADAAKMLERDRSVLFVTVKSKQDNREYLGGGGHPVYVCRIQSNRRTSSKNIDSESWIRHCEIAAGDELEAIARTLVANQELISAYQQAQAVQFGRLNGRGDLTLINLRAVKVEDGGAFHFVGTLDFVVLADGADAD